MRQTLSFVLLRRVHAHVTQTGRSGFYFIALKAELPILLYGLDFERKLIECKHMIVPTGDVEADMKRIKTYFKDFKGKNPELFTVGEL